jgi:penicillin-binding protein 2
MRELDRQEGDPGADIRLTIDADVQNFARPGWARKAPPWW